MWLLLANLIILLKLDYYDRAMIREFKYFIKLDYYDITIVDKFKYFCQDQIIMIKLWFANLNILLKLDYCWQI
jgi:hypothetical protein